MDPPGDNERAPAAPGSVPSQRIQCERLVLRCWHPGDAPLFKRALDASLPELQRWIPWAREEPSALPVIAERLSGYREDFLAGRNALYAVMDLEETDVLGGAGLYRRVGPGALEIGYWVRSDQAGRGFATEATAALTREGFTLSGIERIEIHCNRANLASAAIPRKLGYVHREDGPGQGASPPPTAGGTMVWEMTREGYERAKGALAYTRTKGHSTEA